ncbi:RbsD/FucU domain-containing protein [Sodalis sp. RH21]|uniref:RbsD/FucU domain-containing protein n=1 Tax=unclassified Sodalis (in: enterobacteria) TaxID=2636512 RepID=UPI0039B6DD50
MIKSEILHPELLSCLAKCGHKTNIVITDSNYSFVTNSARDAVIIYLNLAPGMIRSTVILEKIVKYINIETVTFMEYPADFDNTIEAEYKAILPADTDIAFVGRNEFYAIAKSQDTLLVIASGEAKRFANLILTVGVVS